MFLVLQSGPCLRIYRNFGAVESATGGCAAPIALIRPESRAARQTRRPPCATGVPPGRSATPHKAQRRGSPPHGGQRRKSGFGQAKAAAHEAALTAERAAHNRIGDMAAGHGRERQSCRPGGRSSPGAERVLSVPLVRRKPPGDRPLAPRKACPDAGTGGSGIGRMTTTGPSVAARAPGGPVPPDASSEAACNFAALPVGSMIAGVPTAGPLTGTRFAGNHAILHPQASEKDERTWFRIRKGSGWASSPP